MFIQSLLLEKSLTNGVFPIDDCYIRALQSITGSCEKVSSFLRTQVVLLMINRFNKVSGKPKLDCSILSEPLDCCRNLRGDDLLTFEHLMFNFQDICFFHRADNFYQKVNEQIDQFQSLQTSLRDSNQAIQTLKELQAGSLLARNLTSHIKALLEESENMLATGALELRKQLPLIIDVLYTTKNDVAEALSEKSVIWNFVKVISIYFHEFNTALWHLLLLFCVYLLTQYYKLRANRLFFYIIAVAGCGFEMCLSEVLREYLTLRAMLRVVLVIRGFTFAGLTFYIISQWKISNRNEEAILYRRLAELEAYSRQIQSLTPVLRSEMERPPT